MKKILCLVLICLTLTACNNKKTHTTIRVGTIAGPETQLMQVAANVARKRYGLHVVVVPFSDYILPNQALAQGDLQANAFQHAPYLNAQNKAQHFHLVAVAKTFLYPMAIYSNTLSSVDKLPMKAKIALPADPSNESRALLLLQSARLITLKPGNIATYTIQDIDQNRKHLRLIALAAAQLPRTLPDVDAAIINTTFAQYIQRSAHRIFTESTRSPYTNVIATTTALAHSNMINEIIHAYQSPEVKHKAHRLFGNMAICAW